MSLRPPMDLRPWIIDRVSLSDGFVADSVVLELVANPDIGSVCLWQTRRNRGGRGARPLDAERAG